MLSSDILEEQFGATRLVVVMQDETHRVIQTVAGDSGEALELSLVTFNPRSSTLFPHVHKAILDGESMGKAYRTANIPFSRTIRSTSSVFVPESLQAQFTSTGVATIVDVDIFVGDDQARYCNILELYSPAVAWPDSVDDQSQNIKEALQNFEELLESH